VELLVNYFVDKFNRKLGKSVATISPAVLKALQNYSWPGNVRELANVLERAIISCNGPLLQLADRLPDVASATNGPDTSAKSLLEVERQHVVQVLRSAKWKIEGPRGAASQLGLNASTLRSRMVKLNIQRPTELSE